MRPKHQAMSTLPLGRIPNYLQERNWNEAKEHCVELFVMTTLEKDHARRFALQTSRDLLRLVILRHELEKGTRAATPLPPSAADATPAAEETRSVPAGAVYHDPTLDFDELSRQCLLAAKKNVLDFSDVLSAACEAWVTGGGYAALPPKKRINRAVAKAVHQTLAADFFEHHPRERARLGAASRKWTPKRTKEAVDAFYGIF